MTYPSKPDLQIERIKITMKSVAASKKLPRSYGEDLEADFKALDSFKGKTLIWLLRTYGTVLVPIQLGVDPVHITHWLWSNHGQEVIAFIIDTKAGTVERTTFERAEQLIMQPPSAISITSRKQLSQQVTNVLEKGCELRIWAGFESPDLKLTAGWKEWHDYFNNAGNRLMADFMGKAIRISNLGTS